MAFTDEITENSTCENFILIVKVVQILVMIITKDICLYLMVLGKNLNFFIAILCYIMSQYSIFQNMP